MPRVVPCPDCGRNNGAARTTCLYCGAPLPATAETAALQTPTLRPVESWESGFTIVLAPIDQDEVAADQIERLCMATGMDAETAESAVASESSVPVARVSSRAEAELIARLLGERDLGATIVADDALELRRHVRRAQAVHLGEANLDVRVMWGDVVSIPRDEVVLAVEGRIVATRVDLVEGVGKRRGAFDLVDSAQYFEESYAIDLYGPSLAESFRIKADGFDFGCLGARPGLRLDDSVAHLSTALRSYLGPSRYDADFHRLARLLGHAWPRASRASARGLGRKGDFRTYTVSSVVTDALSQFTRYSRTRYRLAAP